jgi:hypothetical protein
MIEDLAQYVEIYWAGIITSYFDYDFHYRI